MNEQHISVFQRLLSGMVCANSALPEKTIGYKERCDTKRTIYRQALAEKKAAGKTIIYTDECGFRAESYRHHGYARKAHLF